MGGFDELTLNEKEVLEELKKRMEGVEMNSELKNDNNMYLRFLRARDFKIDLAEDMLRKHLVWRKASRIDSLFTEYVPHEVCVKYIPNVRFAFDKDGAPVRYFAFGATDCKGLMKASRKNDFITTIVAGFEDDIRVMKEQSLKLGKPIEQWVYILDFTGYTLAKATHKPMLETLIELFHSYEANYPERLKAAFVINSSIYFSMMFSIMKPLLSGATVRKISIYGKDGWKSDLLQHIDPEVLPAFLGGERKDPDGNPMCHTIVMHGKDVPEELYMSRSLNRLSSQPDAKKMIVSRKSKILLPLTVSEVGSMIEWEFETESRDIGFGLRYKESDTKSAVSEELIPKQRIDAHLLRETSMYKCHKAGTYTLVFDNSYSWIYSKEIYFKVSVVAPSDQVQ